MRTWLMAILTAAPALAAAQETQPAEAQPQIIPDEEGPIPDPNVPDVARRPPPRVASAPTARWTKANYPTEIVKRPLTLAAEQAQVSLDMPFVAGDGHPTLTQVLRAGFGVTQDFEIGLTY